MNETPNVRPEARLEPAVGRRRSRRPSEKAARRVIEKWLTEAAPGWEAEGYHLCEDGDDTSAASKCGWAFWILCDDTTSYVHEDLKIEWYGTNFDPPPNAEFSGEGKRSLTDSAGTQG